MNDSDARARKPAVRSRVFAITMLAAGISAGGCSSGGARPSSGADAAVPGDAASAPADADPGTPDQSSTDLAGVDLAGPRADLAGPRADLAVPADIGAPADLSTPPDLAFPTVTGVDIYVDNFCKMDVVPKVFNVPRGATLKVTWYNRSRDYPVTVWLSYGGGYTDLMTGKSWAEPIEHCRLPRPYNEYADISTACSSYRLMMNCL